MSIQDLQWVVSGVLAIMSYFLKRTIDGYDEKIKQSEVQIADIRRDYLHKGDFKEFKHDLRGMFEEIKSDIKEIKYKQG
jgi:hypothetical protein